MRLALRGAQAAAAGDHLEAERCEEELEAAIRRWHKEEAAQQESLRQRGMHDRSGPGGSSGGPGGPSGSSFF